MCACACAHVRVYVSGWVGGGDEGRGGEGREGREEVAVVVVLTCDLTNVSVQAR